VSEFLRLEPARVTRSPLYLWRFVRALRRERFELAIDFEQWSNATAILCALSGAPVRAGFALAGTARHRLYSRVHERPADTHEADIFLGLLERAGVAGADPRLELPVEPARVEAVRRSLEARGWRAGRPLVVIHPGCGAHGGPREWPLERYERLLATLRQERGAFFAITGTPGEAALAGALERAAGADGVALTGAPLGDFIALVSMADLFISGNNGAMHVAAALGAPQVALHGPTSARRWGPRNARASVVRSRCPGCPCLDLGFEYHRTDGFCMRALDEGEVLAAARARLDAGRGAA
jgi:ADP-heptose:LPS heptosyltransferase